VDEDGHADLVLIDTASEAFEVGIEVVEAGEDFAHGPEDAAFVFLGGVAVGGAFVVVIEIIPEAAAVAVVETGPDEAVGVFDVGGAAEAEFFEGVESGGLEGGEDGGFVGGGEVGVVFDEGADGLEIGIEGGDIRGPGVGGEPGGDEVLEGGTVEGLGEVAVPEIEGEGEGGRRRRGNGLAKEAEVGGFSSDVSDVGQFGGGEIHGEGGGALARSEFEGRGGFEVENGGVIFGAEVLGGEDIDVAFAGVLGGTAEDDFLSVESEGGLDVGLIREVNEGDAVGSGEEGDVGVGSAGRRGNDAGDVGDFGGDTVGDEDVGGEEGAVEEGFVDLSTGDKDEAAESPAGGVAGVGVLPSGDAAESDVIALEVVGIFAGAFRLFESWEVETGPVIGPFDDGLYELVEVAEHRGRVGFLADELEGEFLVCGGEKEGSEDDFLFGWVERGGVEVVEGNAGEGIETVVGKIVVELIITAVLEINGGGVVEEDGELDPADFGLAEAGEDGIGAEGVVGEGDGVSPGRVSRDGSEEILGEAIEATGSGGGIRVKELPWEGFDSGNREPGSGVRAELKEKIRVGRGGALDFQLSISGDGVFSDLQSQGPGEKSRKDQGGEEREKYLHCGNKENLPRDSSQTRKMASEFLRNSLPPSSVGREHPAMDSVTTPSQCRKNQQDGSIALRREDFDQFG